MAQIVDASSHRYMRSRPSVRWSVRRMVRYRNRNLFLILKMSRFLYERHRGSPTPTLLNVLGVLGVLNLLNVLNVHHSSCCLVFLFISFVYYRHFPCHSLFITVYFSRFLSTTDYFCLLFLVFFYYTLSITICFYRFCLLVLPSISVYHFLFFAAYLCLSFVY